MSGLNFGGDVRRTILGVPLLTLTNLSDLITRAVFFRTLSLE
jgi:hypothetical protein